MKSLSRSILLASTLVVTALVSYGAQEVANRNEEILRHNNLGVALMEQQNFKEAADEFQKILQLNAQFVPAYVNLGIAAFNLQNYDEALQWLERALQLDPNQIHAHFVRGLIYRNQDQIEAALQAFLKIQQHDPQDPSTHYYLGLLYSRQRDYPKAIENFQKVIQSDPSNASARYNLAIALLRSGEREEGQQQMEEFRKLQEKFGTTTVGLQYLEQGKYSAAIEQIDARYLPGLDRAEAEESLSVVFTEVAAQQGLTFRHYGGSLSFVTDLHQLENAIVPYVGSGIAFGDYDNDGWLDLFIANAGPNGERGALFRNQKDGAFLETTLKAGITFSGKTMGVLWGDFNNDTFVDLYLINYGPNVLYQNQGDGTFADVTAKAGVGDPSWGTSGAFVDYDHDGDLDLFVTNFVDASRLPERGAEFPGGLPGADNVLYRNNGDGTFTDVSKASRLSGGARKTVAVMCTDFNNSRDIDFYVVNLGAPNQLFSNLRDGSFVDVAAEVGLTTGQSGIGVAIGDYNKDGLMDLILPLDYGQGIRLLTQGANHRFNSQYLFREQVYGQNAQFLDFDNDGDLDILLTAARMFHPGAEQSGGEGNFYLLENRQGRFVDATERTGLGRFQSLRVRGITVGDFDNDGDLDFAVNVNGSAPLLLRNDGGSQNNWIVVQTSGTNSNKPGVGAKVEIKAGRLWQKMEVYGGHGFLSQSPPLAHFGLGKHARADILRLLWPGGVLQTEMNPPINQRVKIQELDRKGTSCPILYAWNGRTYRFVTDFLGGSAYGYLLAPGVYNYPDSDEYIKLDRNQIALREGKVAITLNNQLEEVILFDQLELVVVDHPKDYEIFPDEKLLPGPPYDGFRLITTTGLRPPVSAADGTGQDVLPLIQKVDRTYVEGFRKLPFKGYAQEHELILDLGTISPERVLLLLYGWIDYADSTSNLAASQAGLKLTPPYVQVQDAAGKWVTVMDRMGFPAGLPKMMTVDLSGKFLSGSRKVRIVTNMRIYWDQILVESGPPRTDYRLARLTPSYAKLHARGFPEFFSPDGRQPKIYDYERIAPAAQWKAHIGGYTRYGDVLPLLLRRDDLFAIVLAGDEIESFFDLQDLPSLPEGWVRDYLVYVDGFGKDMDPNSARPDYIGPLPFHGMSAYPYPEHERYPDDEAHRTYLKEWNTRIIERWYGEIR